jgi:ChrR Cupin-like domain
MDAVTQKSKGSADLKSHIVRAAEMEWQKTRFPGCEAKTLLLDKQTGLVTALMRFSPGAVLPDHEHVKIEQTYVLEGKLVDQRRPGGRPLGRSRRVRLAPCRQPPRRLVPGGRIVARHFSSPQQILRA